MAVPFIICKFYCFLKVFVILFFNQYLVSRLSSATSSAKKRNIVDEKEYFKKIGPIYDMFMTRSVFRGGPLCHPSPFLTLPFSKKRTKLMVPSD